MPAVFVHGVPETAEVWQPVVRALSRTRVDALSLPGFGVALPEGFVATKEAYLAWLVGELEAIGEPVDLVGHDWGGILVNRVVATRPDLVTTWVTDVAATHEDFVWHQVAQIWQTEGAGEAFWEQFGQSPEEQAAAPFVSVGMPEPAALEMVRRIDEVMQACILTLYRSATAVASEWAIREPVSRPGLVIEAALDPFMPAGLPPRFAERSGARLVHLDDLGHWWFAQAPDVAASLLESFWAEAPRGGSGGAGT